MATVLAVRPKNPMMQEAIQKDPRFAGVEDELHGVLCEDGERRHLLKVSFDLFGSIVRAESGKKFRGVTLWKQDTPRGVFRSLDFRLAQDIVFGRSGKPKAVPPKRTSKPARK